MSDPFLAEIRITSWTYTISGWAHCDGQLLPINQNQALFALLGTTYGGNGQVNFALPDFRGRAPMHTGNGHGLGERGGEQAHTVSQAEMPAHNHTLLGANQPADATVLTNNYFGMVANKIYAPPTSALGTTFPGTVSNVGGSQPHSNMQPYLVLNFIIALIGIFPSRN